MRDTRPLAAIRNYLPLTPRLATSGLPAPDHFALIRDAGFSVLVNLLPDGGQYDIDGEEDTVTDLGMEYVHIPVLWHAPALEDAARFFAAMDAHQDRAVWVHCAVNMRVSTFCYLYRTLRVGIDEAEAARDLRRVWTPTGWWADYVEAVRAVYADPPGG